MGDKIKFGFNKVIKKPNLLIQNGSKVQEKCKIELINEIEGSSIKIAGKNADDEKEKKLVIPMTNDQKTTPLAKLLAQKKLKNLVGIKREAEEGIEAASIEKQVLTDVVIKREPIDETLEQQAARELIEDLQSKEVKSETKIFEVPINPDELPLEGAKESSIDDYERVPISDFGKAMLRGMGWKEEEVKEDKKTLMDAPVQRPKGMGLGADKAIKKQPLLIPPNQSETLEVKRNACIKVLAGKHMNLYGTIEGFDDGGGRVIVKLAIGGIKVTLNEFMVQVVGKQEFAKYGKILNSVKYEKFKSNEDGTKNTMSSSQVRPRNDQESSKPRRNRSPEKFRKQSRSPERRRQSRSPEKNRDRSRSRHRDRGDRYENSSDVRKYRGRSRSRDKALKRSNSSEDRTYKKKSSKHKKNRSSSPDSKYSSGGERKHKKKTKKSKHRKRDRS